LPGEANVIAPGKVDSPVKAKVAVPVNTEPNKNDNHIILD